MPRKHLKIKHNEPYCQQGLTLETIKVVNFSTGISNPLFPSAHQQKSSHLSSTRVSGQRAFAERTEKRPYLPPDKHVCLQGWRNFSTCLRSKLRAAAQEGSSSFAPNPSIIQNRFKFSSRLFQTLLQCTCLCRSFSP